MAGFSHQNRAAECVRMISVALLRGINVGGKNKVEMDRLRATFESAGFDQVSTYINTGNVIFAHEPGSPRAIEERLEAAIADEFGLDLKVLLRDRDTMIATEHALPDSWVNDSAMKSDVMFLWDSIDQPDVLQELTIREGIDDVIYVPGAILWRVDRELLTKSGMTKIVATKLYQAMTVRNVNTLRKLVELMNNHP